MERQECVSQCGEHKGAGPLIARILISLIFIVGGLGKLFGFKMMAQNLSQMGLSPLAEIYLAIAILFEIVGGLMILLGYRTRIGCYLLMIFLLPVTFIIHGFWQYSGAEATNQMFHFLKNLTLYGGLLLLLSYGPGCYSMDWHRYCRKNHIMRK